MNETRCGLSTKQGQQVPLLGVEIDGHVYGAHAQVRVRQRYRNAEPKPVEAVYTFPLPTDATLMGFQMTCDGRTLEGVVKEREQAFRDYDEAIASGHGAGLLDQERPNVFTAQVGNLLPNEETLIDVTYVEPVRADEGVLRWAVPTLVAPRYIPGTPRGDRTGHATAEPTDRVPDADRITPPIGDARYGLRLEVVFETGKPVRVESPSHAISVIDEPTRTRVHFAQDQVALARDVVLTARGVDGAPLQTFAAHREEGKPGTFMVTIVPDLFTPERSAAPQDVVFLIDVSGSMEGASIAEAKSALRLCLRHLREGDRFNVIAFNERFTTFSDHPEVFSQATLERADAWVQSLSADGGTEILAPLRHALRASPDATLVLLTDGQVGNEKEVLEQALALRRRARIYSFGIGTNVSDALLRDLARHSGGAVEFIHPGERVDEKVVAQFARAIAPRVDEMSVQFDGVAVSDLTPAPPRALVDGEPWVIFGRYDRPGRGRLEVRGARYIPGDTAPERFSLTLPIELPERADTPWVQRLWARERVRDLEFADLRGRRAESNRQRIVDLAVEHQLMTAFTSFVVIEHRTGARLATGQPETRVVPVNVPAGWAMFDRAKGSAPWPSLPVRPGAKPAPVVAAAAPPLT
ncbi:MAG: VWA domain-containing protein, partial [Myxococcaceae bacterium]|nr:VWA domain-containing protein [Myxococcaceae bacterium]